jgi:hypothetical protein
MRKKRSSVYKKSKRKTLYQAASLVSIAAFGFAQVIPASQAAFSSTATIKDGQITAAVVFPETIQEILDHIKTERKKIEEQKDFVDEKLAATSGASSSGKAREYANEIDDVADEAAPILEAAYKKVDELENYLALAEVEAKKDESGEKVVELVEEGITTATEITDLMEEILEEIEDAANEADKIVDELVIAEKAAIEQQLIAQLSEEAMKSLTESNTLATDLLSKYGEEFDLDSFEKLTEDFSKSKAELQKALEEAEKYANELKAYVEGEKKTYSEEVLTDAKQNFEKVQSEIKSLKETIEKTKTTNTEALTKIEQEKQKQTEEAAAKLEEERRLAEEAARLEEEKKKQVEKNQQEQDGQSGAPTKQPEQERPPVEEKQPDGEFPPVEGEGTGEGTPPAEGENPNEEVPPTEEEPGEETPPNIGG